MHQLGNAKGIVSGPAAQLFPANNSLLIKKLQKAARKILFGHLTLFVVFLATGYWQMVFIVTLAGFISNGLSNLLASSQHCGMQMDNGDYRESTRTVLLNPVLSFFYWNMNYHVEHHMYPSVPFYNLPRLNSLLTNDLKQPTIGIFELIQEVKREHAGHDQVGGCQQK
jgi:fatty acid desaturase